MHLTYRCYPCILDDLAGAIELLRIDPETAPAIMHKTTEFLAREGRKRKPPSYYITAAHRIFKKETNIAEPFEELRKRTNEIGLEIAARVKKEISKLKDADRFRKLALWCVAANHLDFRTAGTGYAFDPSGIYNMLKKEVRRGLAVDMVNEFRQAATQAKKILYIHDNVGEIAIDALLIEELRHMGAIVTSALRGGPITSDATKKDGRAVGLFEVADNVIVAGPDTLGISLEEMSNELASALRTADLVIAKGQANYYVLPEYTEKNPKQVVYLFSTKCDPVAEKFGLEGKKNIVWMNEPKKLSKRRSNETA